MKVFIDPTFFILNPLNDVRCFYINLTYILNAKSSHMKIKSILTVFIISIITGISLYGQEPAFKISLAEWSLNRTLRKGTITNMDFPRIAKETYGLDAVEYVSTFFKGKAEDMEYLTQLKNECEKYGVKSILIMVDGEGLSAGSFSLDQLLQKAVIDETL